MDNNSQYYENTINDIINTIHTNFDNNIIQLQGLIEEYYTVLYPQQHGGFFVPLTPTIGYTHCHYLNMSRFVPNAENKYRIKCNFLTFEIQDLPETVQPKSITEMIHTIHLISYLKNIYHDLHIAPVHFSNREKGIKGGKFILTDKTQRLVYDWESINTNQFYLHGVKHSDILVNDRSPFPNLSEDLEQFLIYLNTWNNQALIELIRTRELLPELIKRLEKNPVKIRVGLKYEMLENEYSNIHFFNGILGVHEKAQQSRSESINTYQQYIDEYLRQNDYFDKVFFVGNGTLDQDPAFAHYNYDFYKILQRRYAERCLFFVPNPMGPYDQVISSPDNILIQLHDELINNPDQKILFTLGLHGEKDGSASYIGGSFYKTHFEQLFNLASIYKNLQIIIVSCRSGMKTESLVGNIIMSSSRQVSYASYSQYFIEQLYTGKNIYEAHLTSMLQYHDSLLPTSFYDKQGVSKAICPLLEDTTMPNQCSFTGC